MLSNFYINSVYNNYLQMYTPNLTRYDTHKQSELRLLCNSISRFNNDTPWCLPVTEKNAQTGIVLLKEDARKLHNSIAEAGGLEGNSVFTKKNAYSTNEEVLTVDYIANGPESKGESPTFNIEVIELADSQENMGFYLEKDEVALEPDTYSFDIAINDMGYEFQFAINDGETNKDVQERLVRLINNSNTGVHARVDIAEEHTGLIIESDSQGIPFGNNGLIFSISDENTSKRSGAVSYFGIDYVSRPPKNASVIVNGNEESIPSNRFSLDRNFEITLHKTSAEGETVEVGIKPDIDSLVDNISHMIGGYNDFLKSVNEHLNAISTDSQFKGEMNSLMNEFAENLSGAGIELSDEGTLTVNANTLKESVSSFDDIKDSLGFLSGFSNSLLDKANSISMDPMNYVSKKVVAYKNPGRNFESPYLPGPYSGMMFNNYC